MANRPALSCTACLGLRICATQALIRLADGLHPLQLAFTWPFQTLNLLKDVLGVDCVQVGIGKLRITSVRQARFAKPWHCLCLSLEADLNLMSELKQVSAVSYSRVIAVACRSIACLRDWVWEASMLLQGRSYSTYCSGMGTIELIMMWIDNVLPYIGLGHMRFVPSTACVKALDGPRTSDTRALTPCWYDLSRVCVCVCVIIAVISDNALGGMRAVGRGVARGRSVPEPARQIILRAPPKDSSAKCRDQLLHLDSACVFGDMTAACPIDWPADPMAKIALAKASPMSGMLWCYRHHRYCPLRCTSLDVTGTPCVDYSLMSLSRKGIYGPTFPILVVWSELMQRLGVPIWFHENVLGQPRWVFDVLFDPCRYKIFDFEVTPEMVGFGLVERKRRYLMGVDTQRLQIVAHPGLVLDHVLQRLRQVRTRPEHALLASLSEVLREAALECSRRGMALPHHIASCNDLKNLDLTELLTEREHMSLHQFLAAYMNKYGHTPDRDPSAFFFLGDNASARCTWSCGSGKLPTLRCTAGKYWSAMAKRWLTPRELLATMGFPVYEPLAASMGVPEMTFESSAAARHFLGNAMHASVAGVVVTTGLCCVRPL